MSFKHLPYATRHQGPAQFHAAQHLPRSRTITSPTSTPNLPETLRYTSGSGSRASRRAAPRHHLSKSQALDSAVPTRRGRKNPSDQILSLAPKTTVLLALSWISQIMTGTQGETMFKKICFSAPAAACSRGPVRYSPQIVCVGAARKLSVVVHPRCASLIFSMTRPPPWPLRCR
jgi:hypothetical protein